MTSEGLLRAFVHAVEGCDLPEPEAWATASEDERARWLDAATQAVEAITFVLVTVAGQGCEALRGRLHELSARSSATRAEVEHLELAQRVAGEELATLQQHVALLRELGTWEEVRGRLEALGPEWRVRAEAGQRLAAWAREQREALDGLGRRIEDAMAERERLLAERITLEEAARAALAAERR